MNLLDANTIFNIHEKVINPNELQGLAANKSLVSMVARVENRLVYDMIGDVFDLAALYCVIIARSRAFNAGNKRTAFTAMDVCLRINNLFLDLSTEAFAQIIIKTAEGSIDEIDLAQQLRLQKISTERL